MRDPTAALLNTAMRPQRARSGRIAANAVSTLVVNRGPASRAQVRALLFQAGDDVIDPRGSRAAQAEHIGGARGPLAVRARRPAGQSEGCKRSGQHSGKCKRIARPRRASDRDRHESIPSGCGEAVR
jgi:hypothetical protein